MDNAIHPGSPSASLRANWKLRALGGPRTHEWFEASLRQVIAQTGGAEIRDGWLEILGRRHRVSVSLTRPDSAPPGSDFFDVNFTEQSALPEAEPVPTEAPAEIPPPASRQEFLHQLSHDLRTPLSALQLWIKVITEGDDDLPPHVRDGLEAIRQCANEQDTLVKNLVSRPFPR